MNEWMDGWMNEWVDGWMDEWVSGWMDGWDEWVENEWMNEGMVGLDGWMNEWMDGLIEWMNEWMDESGQQAAHDLHAMEGVFDCTWNEDMWCHELMSPPLRSTGWLNERHHQSDGRREIESDGWMDSRFVRWLVNESHSKLQNLQQSQDMHWTFSVYLCWDKAKLFNNVKPVTFEFNWFG